MAESTLSLTYQDIVKVIARQLGYGEAYGTGTLTVSSGVCTLAGGTFPTWIASSSALAAIDIAGTFYEVASRDSATQVTLTDTSVSVGAGARYVVVQAQRDPKTAVLEAIQEIIDTGYREFLCPPPPNEETPYFNWSFLIRQGTLTLATDDEDYDLPDDFGQWLDESMTYGAGVDQTNPSLCSEREMRSKLARSPQEGWPEYVTWRPKTFDATTGSRFEALVHPKPIAAQNGSTIEYNYRVMPDRLTVTNRYPICGALHSDTLLKVCQAAAERKLDDQPGAYAQKAAERLSASMQADMATRRIKGMRF